MPEWYEIENLPQIDSPALLIYPERVEENIRRMVRLARGPERLRPHLKTHKLPQILAMHLAHGINRFKCATIAEAEMAAEAGAADVLVAYQPVGPKADRLLALAEAYRRTNFSTLFDDERTLRAFAEKASQAGQLIEALLDVDCGQGRTGVPPGEKAFTLYQLLGSLPGVKCAGLHVYDGHLHMTDPVERERACQAAFAPVELFVKTLRAAGMVVPRIVAGGTPTFPFHAKRGDVECSPGTCVLWDYGYASKLPDLDFLPAALVLTRVVSKPAPNKYCLDLGHKAIASENPHPRVHFLNAREVQFVGHSEEHLVIQTPLELKVGDPLYGMPWHVCPTVALYSEASPVIRGTAGESWTIAARSRRLRH